MFFAYLLPFIEVTISIFSTFLDGDDSGYDVG